MRTAHTLIALVTALGTTGVSAAQPAGVSVAQPAGVSVARPPEAYAEQVTAANASRRLVGGSDATGGIGDWALGNGVLCAVVSDPEHESQLSPQGGTLLDLGRCGLSHDEWVGGEMLLNMSRDRMVGATSIRAEPTRPDGSVAIVAGARLEGLAIETTYRLAPERPDALEIETRALRLLPSEAGGDAERAFLFGDVVLHGRRQLAPFTLHVDGRGLPIFDAGSVGFAHPPSDPDDMLTMVRAILPANLHVLVGGDAQTPGIAYGVHLLSGRLEKPDGTREPLPQLSINGESFTMQAVFTRPLYFGGEAGIGWIELGQTLLMDLDPGETLVLTREILVGERSDVASVTDQLWPEAPLLRGHTEPDARVHVATAEGAAVSEVRPDASGSFSLHVPPGRYRLTVRGPLGRVQERDVEVAAGGFDAGPVPLSPLGRVLLPRGRPMRLVFVPESGGGPVVFDDDGLDFRVGDRRFPGSEEGPDVALGGIDPDPETVSLQPGRYRVLATRGPEFDLSEARLQVVRGETVPLQIDSPKRVLARPGWVSADLHVHSEWSDDSTFSTDRRIAAFVAEGADLIVSTEHDRVTDYAPELARLGLTGRIASMVGVEVTSSAHSPAAPFTAGHANVYPLPYDPLRFRGGAPRGEGRRLRGMMQDVRGLPGTRIVQLNHPRSTDGKIGDLNLFTHLSVVGEPFQPAQPLSAWPNRVLLERDSDDGLRDLDFDVLEVWNGDSMRQFRATRADWYSLLLQGEIRTAVANSDSHVRRELVAHPRTYVRLPEKATGEAAPFDAGVFVEALRAGHAYGTSGPLLAVTLADPSGESRGIGELYHGRSGRLRVDVEAAPWVPVSRLVVRWNGEVVRDEPIRAGAPVEHGLDFGGDGFLTVEVSGEPSGDYALVAPGFVPFAFANPIFVDADGDGRFTAPGLPPNPLPVLDPETMGP